MQAVKLYEKPMSETPFTNHSCCVDDISCKMDFPKPYSFVMSIFNGGVISMVSHAGSNRQRAASEINRFNCCEIVMLTQNSICDKLHQTY